MPRLRVDYKDDIFVGKRKYEKVINGDSTVSFDDETFYVQKSNSYGGEDINALNTLVNNLDAVTYKTSDAAEVAIADDDYFPFYDTSSGKQKKTLWSNTKTVLIGTFAIKNHASSQTIYGTSSLSLFGHCKLFDDYTRNNGAAAAGAGASSKGLNDAYTVNRSNINALNNSISSLQSSLSTTNTNLNNLSTRVSEEGSDITALKPRVTANETNIAALKTRFTTLENEMTANGKRIYFDYKNGKYGINTQSNRSLATFIPI